MGFSDFLLGKKKLDSQQEKVAENPSFLKTPIAWWKERKKKEIETVITKEVSPALSLKQLRSFSPEFIVNTYVIDTGKRLDMLRTLSLQKDTQPYSELRDSLLRKLYTEGLLPIKPEEYHLLYSTQDTEDMRAHIKKSFASEAVRTTEHLTPTAPTHDSSVATLDPMGQQSTLTGMDIPEAQKETDPTFQFDQFLKTRNAKKHSSPSTTVDTPSRGYGAHAQEEVFAQDSNSRKIRTFKEMLEKSTVARKEAIPEILSKDPSLLKEEWKATSFAHIILRDLSSVEQLIAQAEQVLYARKHIDFSMEEPAIQQVREEALPVLKEKINALKERTFALKKRAVSPKELRDILNTARIIKDDFMQDGALNIDATEDQIIFDTISDEEIDQMGVKHIKTDFNDEKKQD